MQALARLWLLATLPALAGNAGWSALGEVVSAGGVRFAGGGGMRRVLAAAGQDVTLLCQLNDLGDKAVSWVRSRDLQILSHAGLVFTADARVSATESRDRGASSEHALRIARLRPDDSGRYECQVNTDPKLSLLFNLTVIDEPMPRLVVRALEGGRVAGALGGAATLACEARYEPAPRALPLPPLALSWSREGQPLSPQGRRGVSLETERWAARVVSRLTLGELRAADAGEYSCRAAERADTVLLQLHAHSEDGAEAMQRDQSEGAGAGAWAGEGGRGVSAALLAAPLLLLLR